MILYNEPWWHATVALHAIVFTSWHQVPSFVNPNNT